MPIVKHYDKPTRHVFPTEELYIKAKERGEVKEGDEVAIIDDGLPDLPPVTEADEGKVLQVEGGKWVANELPTYEGEIVLTPSTENGQTLLTEGKYAKSNITVEKIPYSEVSNPSGGTTVIIG